VYSAYGSGVAPIVRNSTGGPYGSSITVTGDYNVVEGLLVRDARDSGVMIRAGADRNVVRDVEVTSVGNGITSAGQHNLLTRNYVHDLKMIVNTSGGDDDYGAVCFWIEGPDNEVSHNRGVNCRAPSYDTATTVASSKCGNRAIALPFTTTLPTTRAGSSKSADRAVPET
jgi:hypothetical protein